MSRHPRALASWTLQLLHLLENLESAQALNVADSVPDNGKTHALSEKQKP
jgi:hypothetical protein